MTFFHSLIRKPPSIWLTGETIPPISFSTQSNFKYHTDQTMCIILEKLSKPSILTFVRDAKNNRLQGDGPREHNIFFICKKENRPPTQQTGETIPSINFNFNTCFGCSKEPSRCGDPPEHPQHVFNHKYES